MAKNTTPAAEGGAQGCVWPSVTVVVCTRDHPEQLRACLRALAAVEYPSYEVLVVDNAPSSLAGEAVCREAGVRYLVEPAPGLSRARNAGARASTAEIVAYIDDDALAESGWLVALARTFADPQVMAAGGKVVPVEDDGDSQRAGRLRGSYRGSDEARILTRSVPGWFEQANFGALGIGTNMAFRRRAFEVWPGFDTRLGRGAPLEAGEETYAFSSLIKEGYAVAYTPEAVVRHPFQPPLEDRLARRARSRAALTAYLTFLLAEEPRYALDVLWYALKRAFGVRMEWRTSVELPEADLLSRRQTLAALMRGPRLYWRQRRGGNKPAQS